MLEAEFESSVLASQSQVPKIRSHGLNFRSIFSIRPHFSDSVCR